MQHVVTNQIERDILATGFIFAVDDCLFIGYFVIKLFVADISSNKFTRWRWYSIHNLKHCSMQFFHPFSCDIVVFDLF